MLLATKCAVSLGLFREDGRMKFINKTSFPTGEDPHQVIQKLEEDLTYLMENCREENLRAIGISCGGPLDSKRGFILSPPNVPN